MDKSHEGGPRIFRAVRAPFRPTTVPLSYTFVFSVIHVCMFGYVWLSGREHTRPSQREASSGAERELQSAGGEGEE